MNQSLLDQIIDRNNGMADKPAISADRDPRSESIKDGEWKTVKSAIIKPSFQLVGTPLSIDINDARQVREFLSMMLICVYDVNIKAPMLAQYVEPNTWIHGDLDEAASEPPRSLDTLKPVLFSALADGSFSVYSPKLLDSKVNDYRFDHQFSHALHQAVSTNEATRHLYTSASLSDNIADHLSFTGNAAYNKAGSFLLWRFQDEVSGEYYNLYRAFLEGADSILNELKAFGLSAIDIDEIKQAVVSADQAMTTAETKGIDRRVKLSLMPVQHGYNDQYIGVTPVLHNGVVARYAQKTRNMLYVKRTAAKPSLIMDARIYSLGGDVKNTGMMGNLINGQLHAMNGLAPSQHSQQDGPRDVMKKLHRTRRITAIAGTEFKTIMERYVRLGRQDFNNRNVRKGMDFHLRSAVRELVLPAYRLADYLADQSNDIWAAPGQPFAHMSDLEKAWLDPRQREVALKQADIEALVDQYFEHVAAHAQDMRLGDSLTKDIKSLLEKEVSAL